jgi:transcriptional regulator with GAF, ATPase, and Fis domain
VGRFEVADEGTLFLDEVGEIPIRLQAKLLRVLQEGQLERIGESHSRTVDVRVIAASNRDLRAAVADRTFRSDLYHRLSVVPIHVPPLRERSADVVLLAEHFLKQCCDRLKVSPLRLRSSDVELLESHSWPGNVRELENVIERGVILGRDGRLTLDIGESGQNTTVVTGSRDPAGVDPDAPTLEDVARLERAVIVRALESAGGRIYGPAGAAAKLGLKATTLASRMKRMGIKRRTDTGDKDVALSGRSTPTV